MNEQNWKIHRVGIETLEATLNEVDNSKNFGVANIIPPFESGNSWVIVARRLEERPPGPSQQTLPPEVQAALQKQMAEQNT